MRRGRAVLLACAVALLAVGCGGDDEPASSPSARAASDEGGRTTATRPSDAVTRPRTTSVRAPGARTSKERTQAEPERKERARPEAEPERRPKPERPASESGSAQRDGKRSGPTATVLARARLRAPGENATAEGVALVVVQDEQTALILRAEKLDAAPGKSAHAVWLRGSRGDRFVGFLVRRVGKDGKLESVSAFDPDTLKGYDELLLTHETQERPDTPGRVVLRGAIRKTEPVRAR